MGSQRDDCLLRGRQGRLLGGGDTPARPRRVRREHQSQFCHLRSWDSGQSGYLSCLSGTSPNATVAGREKASSSGTVCIVA